MAERDILPQSAVIPVSDYVIIGGSGDLSLRKIFPALLQRYKAGQVTDNFRLIVASRKAITQKEFKAKLEPYCRPALDENPDGETLMDRFLNLVQIMPVDLTEKDSLADLAAQLLPKTNSARPLIFYLSIAPSLFSAACQRIHEAGLVLPQSRLVVEKPLGHDRNSSLGINDELLAVFREDQIYRIDHYLGKETVQNLMALRFANVIFEALWNNRYIDNVQLTVAETVGAGGRAAYYDQYGAIRDMVQNHLLQLLCLVAMEPPARFNAGQVRNEKLRVLQALRPIKPDDICVGQYEDYAEEVGRSTTTETYIALKAHIDNWRWAGVPFYIRTGKKMACRASEIVITFKNRPHDIFSKDGITHENREIPNRLIIRVQPHEGLRLLLTSKEPGPGGMRLFPSELNLSFGEAFAERLPDAYERLLMDIARGNQTLFMRLDEVLAAWDFIDPVVASAAKTKPQLYKAGSMGPSDTILAQDNRAWVNPPPQ